MCIHNTLASASHMGPLRTEYIQSRQLHRFEFASSQHSILWRNYLNTYSPAKAIWMPCFPPKKHRPENVLKQKESECETHHDWLRQECMTIKRKTATDKEQCCWRFTHFICITDTVHTIALFHIIGCPQSAHPSGIFSF